MRRLIPEQPYVLPSPALPWPRPWQKGALPRSQPQPRAGGKTRHHSCSHTYLKLSPAVSPAQKGCLDLVQPWSPAPSDSLFHLTAHSRLGPGYFYVPEMRSVISTSPPSFTSRPLALLTVQPCPLASCNPCSPSPSNGLTWLSGRKEKRWVGSAGLLL